MSGETWRVFVDGVDGQDEILFSDEKAARAQHDELCFEFREEIEDCSVVVGIEKGLEMNEKQRPSLNDVVKELFWDEGPEGFCPEDFPIVEQLDKVDPEELKVAFAELWFSYHVAQDEDIAHLLEHKFQRLGLVK